MKILLVEDDYLEAEITKRTLVDAFPGVAIDHVSSTFEFSSRLPDILHDPPDVAVIDMMLTSDVKDEGHYRGGLQCQAILTSRTETAHMPIIIYSILDPSVIERGGISLPDHVVPVAKTADQSNLIRTIHGLLQSATAIARVRSSVFIVHGHDDEAKESVARFIERIGLQAIILHEQATLGKTIIEKFEAYSDVRFAVILLTPDDVGAPRSTPKALKSRARQNVIFELGFFVAKLGRRNVCALYKEGVEVPSDIQGLLYITMDTNGAWRLTLAREISACGVAVDMTKLL
jgi:predicted nucleotide-binding protein/CheY-like chemotaxis protein